MKENNDDGYSISIMKVHLLNSGPYCLLAAIDVVVVVIVL